MKRSPIAAFALITLGSIFLLNNLGYLSWDIWQTLFRFWPVLLILIGLESLLFQKSSDKIVVIAAIIVFGLPFVINSTSLPFNFKFDLPFLGQQVGTMNTATFEQKLGTLIASRVEATLTTGNFNLAPLEKGSATLLTGQLSYSKLAKEPTVTYKPKDGVGHLVITPGEGGIPLVDQLSHDWKLTLSQTVPFDLALKSDGGKTDLDLALLSFNQLTLDVGKTETVIVFGESAKGKVDILSTEGTINLTIPEGVGSSIEIPEGAKIEIATRFRKVGNAYQTDNYEKSQQKLKVQIDPGNAQVTIN